MALTPPPLHAPPFSPHPTCTYLFSTSLHYSYFSSLYSLRYQVMAFRMAKSASSSSDFRRVQLTGRPCCLSPYPLVDTRYGTNSTGVIRVSSLRPHVDAAEAAPPTAACIFNRSSVATQTFLPLERESVLNFYLQLGNWYARTSSSRTLRALLLRPHALHHPPAFFVLEFPRQRFPGGRVRDRAQRCRCAPLFTLYCPALLR
jgi:hypothetical protein